MIFGSDGKSIQKSGNNAYFTDEGYAYKSGNMYFGPNGQSATEGSGMIFTNHGTITQSGDMFHTPNGTYHRSGSMLFGPNGQSWTGLESVEDAKVVIMNDLASSNAGKKQDFSATPLIPWDKSEGKPIELPTGATLALIALIGIGALLMVIFL